MTDAPTKETQSCVGCKFLYLHDSGYSNWTVEETDVCCAKKLNTNLPASEPYDWIRDPDNWPMTNAARCASYAHGPMVHLDVDGEETAASQTDDLEAIQAIDGASS